MEVRDEKFFIRMDRWQSSILNLLCFAQLCNGYSMLNNVSAAGWKIDSICIKSLDIESILLEEHLVITNMAKSV